MDWRCGSSGCRVPDLQAQSLSSNCSTAKNNKNKNKQRNSNKEKSYPVFSDHSGVKIEVNSKIV
jgi:hypothetical protein